MSVSTLSILDGYTPADFGLTEYASYRKHPETGAEVQLEVIEFAAYTDKRFAACAAPVGIGKMLVAITLAKLTGLRTAIVVPYKGLQEQYIDKLGKHLVDIRGKSNYPCADYAHLDCKGGSSMGCRYMFPSRGCTYDVAKAVARDNPVVVTNYDYWLNVNDHVGGLKRTQEEAKWFGDNPIELLILDEGDEAADKVADYLSVRISEGDVKRWTDPKQLGDSVPDWQQFIRECKVVEDLEAEIRTTGMELAHLGRSATRQQVKTLHDLERLLGKFTRISTAQGGEWVCEARIGTRLGRQWSFDIVWPGRYTEQYLFCNIPKVVIMSGTLTPKDMSLLGVKREDYEYRQWDRIFPAATQPIYLCPARKKNPDGKWTTVRIDRKTKPEDLVLWQEWQDQLIESRLDRKILVGTSSYEWARYIMEHSRFAEYMIGNTDDPDSESAAEIAEQFYKMRAPKILVSPSFGRGWDFAFDRAEVAILVKCPFIPMFSKVMQARLARDEKYGDHVTMKKIEQFNGRIKRDPLDRGETFLMDGHFTYFLPKNAVLAQKWFVKSVRSVLEIPPAPPKLVR